MGEWEPIVGETPIDPSGLIAKGVRNRGDLAVAEARNIRLAVVRYLAAKPGQRLAPFDVPWLLTLHREMFGQVWEWAGSVRSSRLNLGVEPHLIRSSLAALCGDLSSWTGFRHSHEHQAVWLHHRSVNIHPFLNGNGRWARLLANIWLRRHDAPLTIWPEETIGGTSPVRDEYLTAIRAADEGDDSHLAELHARFAER
jgi:Fic-DOC domain mobile mystery protein B